MLAPFLLKRTSLVHTHTLGSDRNLASLVEPFTPLRLSPPTGQLPPPSHAMCSAHHDHVRLCSNAMLSQPATDLPTSYFRRTSLDIDDESEEADYRRIRVLTDLYPCNPWTTSTSQSSAQVHEYIHMQSRIDERPARERYSCMCGIILTFRCQLKRCWDGISTWYRMLRGAALIASKRLVERFASACKS